MHIKELRLKNFRSYAECHIQFSPHVNGIYGLNGSGKSNILKAIEYVLSHTYLRPHNCEYLYRDVSFVPRNSGSVRPTGTEIVVVVDNHDRRIPADQDEIIFKREIRLKTDQFYFNGKKINKKEMEEFLETSGLSCMNPYYFVHQGMITQISEASPIARHRTLKDIAGFSYYEEKRKSMMVDLNNCDKKMQNIDLLFAEYKREIDKMGATNKDFLQFKKLEREITVCRYGIETVKARAFQKTLAAEEAEMSSQLRPEVARRENELREIEAQLVILNKNVNDKSVESRRLETLLSTKKDERDELVARYSKNECLKISLESELTDLKTNTLDESMAPRLEEEMRIAESDRDKVAIEFNVMKEEEVKTKKELNGLKAQQERMINRQAAAKAFKGDRKKRDKFLREKIRDIDAIKRTCEDNIVEHEQIIEEQEKNLRNKSAHLQDIIKEKSIHKEKYEKLKKLFEDCKTRLVNAKSKILEATKETSMKETEYDIIQTNTVKFENNLKMPFAVKIGFNSITVIIDSLKEEAVSGSPDKEADAQTLLDNYYGLLIDHIVPVNDSFIVAVEVIAGNKLWHYVVDNSLVATEFLKRQKSMKLPGEINFISVKEVAEFIEKTPPINQEWIQGKLPQHSNAIQPALKLIESNTMGVQAVLDFVYGQNLVCKKNSDGNELKIACDVRARARKQCVTLEGEKIEKKGAMTGGFRNFKESKIQTWREYQELRHLRRKAGTELKTCREELETLQNHLSAESLKLEKIKHTMERLRLDLEYLISTEVVILQEISATKNSLGIRRKALEEAKENGADLKDKISVYEDEMKQGIASQLTDDEELEMIRLVNKIQLIEGPLPEGAIPQMVAINENLLKVEMQFNQLEISLTNKRRDFEAAVKDQQEFSINHDHIQRLEARVASISVELKKDREALSLVEKELEENEKRQESLNREHAKLREEVTNLDKRVFAMNQALKEAIDACKSSCVKSKEADKALTEARKKMSHYELQLKPAEKKVPEDARVWKLEKRIVELAQNQNELSYDPVVASRFKEVMEDWTKLEKQKTKLKNSRLSCEDLLSHMEERKSAAIQDTFDRVAAEFQEIFATLVPGGSGKFIQIPDPRVLVATEEIDSTDSSSTTSTQKRWGENRFNLGLDIEATFDQDSVPMKSIQSLSGGQKSLVALAFIFAIQRVDPSPFYILDEADAHIDDNYKVLVADMIERLSQGEAGSQFIITAHKKGLVDKADMILRVKMVNHQSRVAKSSLKEALRYFEKRQDNSAFPEVESASVSSSMADEEEYRVS